MGRALKAVNYLNCLVPMYFSNIQVDFTVSLSCNESMILHAVLLKFCPGKENVTICRGIIYLAYSVEGDRMVGEERA